MITPTLDRRTLLAVGAAAITASRPPWSASAQPATPTDPAAPSSGGSLPALLARVATPPTEGGGSPVERFTYADIERQLETRGLRGLDRAAPDRDRLREWGDGIDGLWLDDLLAQYALVPELWESVGFAPADVTQTMTLGDPPAIVRLYRGAFDGEAISAALATSGYAVRETGHGPVWSIGAEGEIDLDSPVQRLVLSAYNNVVVVDGELVVSSPQLGIVEATLGVLAGDEPSLRSDRAVVDLLAAAGVDLVSAVLLDGPFLGDPATAVLGEGGVAPTAAPEETIPPISLALFGITAGSMPPRSSDTDDAPRGENDDTAPPAVLVVAVQLGSAGEAARAVPIVERRLAEGLSSATSRPYADYFERWDVEAVDGGSIVRLVIEGDIVGRRWREFILRRDLGFLFTG